MNEGEIMKRLAGHFSERAAVEQAIDDKPLEREYVTFPRCHGCNEGHHRKITYQGAFCCASCLRRIASALEAASNQERRAGE